MAERYLQFRRRTWAAGGENCANRDSQKQRCDESDSCHLHQTSRETSSWLTGSLSVSDKRRDENTSHCGPGAAPANGSSSTRIFPLTRLSPTVGVSPHRGAAQ